MAVGWDVRQNMLRTMLMPQNMHARFRVMSMNIHKGVSPLYRHATIDQLRQQMRLLHPDLLFLQEVQQKHRMHVRRFAQWPTEKLTCFLAQDFWYYWHYGKNVAYPHGHHGNAILSRYPLEQGRNYDISAYHFEQRGLLHAVIQFKNQKLIHCFCVHLALFEGGRKRQLGEIIRYVTQLAGEGPAIVAGDFNDWRNRASSRMQAIGFREVFEVLTGSPAKTFPSIKPLLPMDRIYVRGLKVHTAEILHEWRTLSDHLGITAELEIP